VREPGRSAIGTWSGGRFLHFGEAIDEDRLTALLRPGEGIDTVLTADTYGQGEADAVLGRALERELAVALVPRLDHRVERVAPAVRAEERLVDRHRGVGGEQEDFINQRKRARGRAQR